MAEAKITFIYNEETGEYEIYFDMEQETLNIALHDRNHESLIREFFQESEVEIEKVKEEGTRAPQEEKKAEKRKLKA